MDERIPVYLTLTSRRPERDLPDFLQRAQSGGGDSTVFGLAMHLMGETLHHLPVCHASAGEIVAPSVSVLRGATLGWRRAVRLLKVVTRNSVGSGTWLVRVASELERPTKWADN